jgi:hypothetical protein
MGHGSQKRSKRSKDTELPHHKLLKYSVKGRSSKLRKWLKRDSSLANALLPDGSTPLHQVRAKAVKQLACMCVREQGVTPGVYLMAAGMPRRASEGCQTAAQVSAGTV